MIPFDYDKQDNGKVKVTVRAGQHPNGVKVPDHLVGLSMEMGCTETQLLCGKNLYDSGRSVQEAFGFLNVDEREFLVSGLTPEEWDKLFPFGEE